MREIDKGKEQTQTTPHPSHLYRVFEMRHSVVLSSEAKVQKFEKENDMVYHQRRPEV